MLYHLLFPLHTKIGWLRVFQYPTFRALLAFLVAFVLVLFWQPLFIRWLRERGVKGQPIRDDGPKDHFSKKGTPTMGGLVIVLAVLLSSLLLCDLTNAYVWVTLFTLVALAGLGFLDDWRKVTKQNTKGISGRTKLMCQAGIAGAVGLFLFVYGFPTELMVPFYKEPVCDLRFLFILLMVLVVVSSSNAVNLTDGLDGLAIGPVMSVAATFGALAYVASRKSFADYLGVYDVPGAGEITVILASVMSAGLGFLWYNTFPAQIFMGDTGSLALGGVLGTVAVLVKQELLLVIAGGIFVLEAVSVIIQVYSYKLTGKRVFRMAPIHHHFELKGWPEPKIIVRAWIVSIVLAVISLTTLKLR